MVNYQLYRTNILLGGQLKYDLMVHNSDTNLSSISELYISPISQEIPHTDPSSANIINNSHLENIVDFYKHTSSYFYNSMPPQTLINHFPLVNEHDGETGFTTYEMGCRRLNYQRYGKQFEFFCPVWIERIKDISEMSFVLKVKVNPQDKPVYERKINFSDKLISYFNKFITEIGLNNGQDWLLNINEKNSIIRAVDVKSGNIINKKLITLYNNLIYRERPMLEFNNLIINELRKNNLIAPQLFNFNLCFNLEDIINEFLYKELASKPLYIDLCISINNQELDKMDLFSNHNYLDRQLIELPKLKFDPLGGVEVEYQYSNQNVFDYLDDYNCIDLIDKNKIDQQTCYWQLISTPNKIFNVYPGFYPISQNYTKDNIYDSEVAVLYESVDSDYGHWCNNYFLDRWKDENKESIEQMIKQILSNSNKFDHMFSKFYDGCIVKNIQYKVDRSSNPKINWDDEFLNVVVFQYEEYDSDNETFEEKISNIVNLYNGWEIKKLLVEGEKHICIIKPRINNFESRKLIILCNRIDQKNIKYAKFINLFKDKEGEEDELLGNDNTIIQCGSVNLLDFIKNPTTPDVFKLLNFKNGLRFSLCKSPSLNSKEIEYFKIKTNKNIVREFGKIKPYFISPKDRYKNYKYTKQKAKEFFETPTNKIFINSNFDPKYPSIGYFPLKFDQEFYEYKECLLENKFVELHHFSFNKILHLQPDIQFSFEVDSNILVDNVDFYIIEHLKKIYKEFLDSANNEEKSNYIKYIYNKYKLYKMSTNINGDKRYIYDIQIKLM